MITCVLPDFDSDDFVSYQNPVKFWILFTTRWLLSDQISLCDQIGDQITAVTKMEVKLAADQNGNQIPVMVIWSEMIDMLI